MDETPKPEKHIWTERSASAREMLRDVRIVLLPMLPVSAIALIAALYVRRLIPPPFGASALVAFVTMLLVGLLLTPLFRRVWRRIIVPRLITPAPIHSAILALSLACTALLVALVGAFAGIGSIDFTIAIVGPIGIILLLMGRMLRSGASRHCPKCDFETPPPNAPLPDRCPECGLQWKSRLIKGRRVRPPLLVRTGAAFIGFWIVIAILSRSGVGPLLSRSAMRLPATS